MFYDYVEELVRRTGCSPDAAVEAITDIIISGRDDVLDPEKYESSCSGNCSCKKAEEVEPTPEPSHEKSEKNKSEKTKKKQKVKKTEKPKDDEAEEPKITKEELRKLFNTKSNDGKKAQMLELLKEYGATKIPQLDEKVYAEIYKKAEAV